MYYTYFSLRCGDHIFGREAAEIWSKLMQWAEGGQSFKRGYEKMKRKYVNDRDRLEYIEELFRDPNKALWRRTWCFCNAVVVDVCECLFSALKRWVLGRSGQSVSLLMAVVRIIEGCRLMMLKSFLKSPTNTLKRIVKPGAQPATVNYLLRRVISKLTSRAVETMHSSLIQNWCTYNLEIRGDLISVTNRYSGDEFIVDHNFKCWCDHQPCWQQTYTGLPCKHVMFAAVERLRSCEEEEDKLRLCDEIVNACNKNWLRSTYTNEVLRELKIPSPPTSVYFEKVSINPDLKMVLRFKQVLKYVRTELVEQFLQTLEARALVDEDVDPIHQRSSSTSDNSDTLDDDITFRTSQTDIRNPPKRKKRNSDVIINVT